jgi:threonine aldolase
LDQDECGAPEKHLGVKLLTLSSEDGKITPAQIEKLLVRRGDQHHVQPRVVSITQPTELGVCYSPEELKELRAFTRRHQLLLHMDGARLANAAYFLQASFRELTGDIGLDALSLGGTKNGLLGAEAVIFWNQDWARDFKFHRKQMMQLPSKMRFLAAQFSAYFHQDLWREIASHSHAMALSLKNGLEGIPGVEILHPVESNAVFIRFPKTWTKTLKEQMFFYIWDETRWSGRLMASFDTRAEDINEFVQCARRLSHDLKGDLLHE